jgi:hypothetical protein
MEFFFTQGGCRRIGVAPSWGFPSSLQVTRGTTTPAGEAHERSAREKAGQEVDALLHVLHLSGPSDGTLTVDGGGFLTYTASGAGLDSFQFGYGPDVPTSTAMIDTQTGWDPTWGGLGGQNYTVSHGDTLTETSAGGLATGAAYNPDPGATISMNLLSGPASGTLTYSSSGAFTYVPAASDYLRYFSPTDPDGDGGALKYAFGSAAYARLTAEYPGSDPDTLTDAEVAPYADTALAYNYSGQVATQTTSGTGCSSCSGGLGTSTFTYASSGSGGTGTNTWQNEVDQTLPNGTQSITFTNYAGATMLTDSVGTTGLHSPNLTQYNDSGEVVLTAQPSAFVPDSSGNYYSTADANLVGYGTYLSATSGLIQTTDWYNPAGGSATTGGAAPGYEEDTKVQQGTGGTPILQESLDYYTVTDSSGAAIYPLADHLCQYRRHGSAHHDV